jgi:hypothetical protein
MHIYTYVYVLVHIYVSMKYSDIDIYAYIHTHTYKCTIMNVYLYHPYEILRWGKGKVSFKNFKNIIIHH